MYNFQRCKMNTIISKILDKHIFISTILLTGLPALNIIYIKKLAEQKNVRYTCNGNIYKDKIYGELKPKNEWSLLEHNIHSIFSSPSIMLMPILSLHTYIYTIPSTYSYFMEYE